MRVPTSKPFALSQTLAFLRRFPPCQGEYLVGEHTLTAAVALDDRAIAYTLSGAAEVEIDRPELVRHAADFIGANDPLDEFYAAARGDVVFRPLVELLHGLHHVRFQTLEEIAVYCVLMQRNPVTAAARMKRRFLEAFGIPVAVSDHTLYAWPRFARLGELSAEEIGEAIRHRRKGEQIATVVRAVAAIGEQRLREAPYAEARDALLEIPGIGPFSAGAILLRGLGRMDELPEMPAGTFGTASHWLYGDRFDRAAIERRYGRHIGYWSFYLMTGVPRLPILGATTAPARARSASSRA